jgi:hypothetical protein
MKSMTYTPLKAKATADFRLKNYHKPLSHYRYISMAAFLLLFVAFILFLLVALSASIIKTIFLVKVTAPVDQELPETSVATTLVLGVWGLCATRSVENS